MLELPPGIELEKTSIVCRIISDSGDMLVVSQLNIEAPDTPCIIITGISSLMLARNTLRPWKIAEVVHGLEEKLYVLDPEQVQDLSCVNYDQHFKLVPLRPDHLDRCAAKV